MRRFTNLFLSLSAASVAVATAQTTKVTGTVVSADDDSPVIGASVVVAGTTTGTVTDYNGSFVLDVPSSAKTLIISYIGMESVQVPVKPIISIVMKSDAQDLDEVVVVGYGTQRKKDVTSAISKVGGKDLGELQVGSFDTQLAGRAAGVQVSTGDASLGSVPRYQIRGVASMTSSTQPLIVVDGMPVVSGDMTETSSEGSSYNAMSDINPNDIESVEILKDGAATAIYGSRAANGVILITTKRGSQGKMKLTYDGSISWSNATKRYDLLNAAQFKEAQDLLFGNYGDESPVVNDGTDTDWQDWVMRTAFQHSHTLSASGGTDKTQYYFSVGYTNQEGIIRSNSMERYNIKANLDQRVNKWLKVGMNTQATRNTILGQANGTNSLSGAMFAATRMLPNVAVMDPNNSTGYNISGKSLGKGSNKDEISNSIPNIVWVLDNNVYRNSNTRVMAGGYGEITILPELIFKTQAGIDYSMVRGNMYWNPDSGDGYGYKGYLMETNARYDNWNWQNV